MPTILINNTFKKYLITKNKDYRALIRKQFEFLEIGSWNGSLNVKRVKGTSENKAIFEGRLNRGDRILFTIGSNEDYNDLLIYIWGIVPHDDISIKSKAIIPANVPFLNFTPYSESELRDIIFEDLDKADFTQENITEHVSDESGTQRWYPVEIPEWDRIQFYTKDEFELYLLLTPQQKELLNLNPPLLISGTAGSGKTTISIYYLLKKETSQHRKLFITYNKFLQSTAEQLYKGLLNADMEKSDYNAPHFLTYKEFCWNIAASVNRYFNPDKEVKLETFTRLLFSGKKNVKYDATLIWEEIRSIIKGALPQINGKLFESVLSALKTNQLNASLVRSLKNQILMFSSLESSEKFERITLKYLKMNIPNLVKALDFPENLDPERLRSVIEGILELFTKQRELTRKKYLSFVEYEMMGRKKAPNFAYDRKEIYQIFEWYQDQLESGKLWDELDLTHEAMNILNTRFNDKFIYDMVICDEIQDLTDIQHELLFSIVKNPYNLILSGDSRQIINPSGFRWEELKQHFYNRNIKVPELSFLNMNFRSSGSIVELSNKLLDIKTGLLGLSSEQLKEEWKFKSRPPVIASEIKEAQVFESLKITGAKKTILVRTNEEKEKLKKHLGTDIIFTIHEAKGLEFDTVLLWKFCSDETTLDIWKSILEESHQSIHSSKIRHEINLLYVAITRAQKDLLIYDGYHPSIVWNSDQLKDFVFFSGDPEYINNIWFTISTPEEWKSQGDYFFDRSHYKAAVECYKNAEALDKFEMAKAYLNEAEGNYGEAAVYFELNEEPERAARNYEKANLISDAFRLWNKLQNKDKIKEYQIKVLEAEGSYSELSSIYFAMKDFSKAAEYAIKSGDLERAAKIYESKLKKYELAANCFEKAANLEKAAGNYAKLKKYDTAAGLYQKAGNLKKAEQYWKKSGNESRLIVFYEQSNNLSELLKYFEKRKDVARISHTLTRMFTSEEITNQADELFEKQDYFKAYVRYHAVRKREKEALCLNKLKKFKEAAEIFDSLRNYYSAGEAYYSAKEYSKSFHSYIRSEKDKSDGYVMTNQSALMLNDSDIFRAGQEFFNKKEYESALQCSIITKNQFNIGVCQYSLKNYDEAVKAWSTEISYADFEPVAKFCQAQLCIDLFAEAMLQATISSRIDYYNFPSIKKNSTAIPVMDEYFKKNPDEVKMLKWAQRIYFFDKNLDFTNKTIEYYEKSKQYNDYANFLYQLMYEYEDGILDQIKRIFRKTSSQDNYIQTLRYLVLKEDGKYNDLAESLNITENNYVIFTYGSKKDEAYELMFSLADDSIIERILSVNREHLLLAQRSESKGDLESAVISYRYAHELDKAAELLLKMGEVREAGDIYFNSRQYEKALKVYQMDDSNLMKTAKTLIKLNEFDKAADIYKKSGKTDLYKKTLEKKKKFLFQKNNQDLTLFK